MQTFPSTKINLHTNFKVITTSSLQLVSYVHSNNIIMYFKMTLPHTANYPTTYTDSSNNITYSKANIIPLPRTYPKSFHSIVQDLLVCEPERRLCVSEALNQLKVCCSKRKTVSLSELKGLSGRKKGSESVSKLLAAAFSQACNYSIGIIIYSVRI